MNKNVKNPTVGMDIYFMGCFSYYFQVYFQTNSITITLVVKEQQGFVLFKIRRMEVYSIYDA